ncbi:hypothetical protein PInf_003794 [Phytophthora infestans]|nr:hypothetical protein PInf_003794 [Phytophthora infestans]
MDDDSRMSETSSVRHRGPRRASSPLGELDAADDAGKLSASHVRPQLRCNAPQRSAWRDLRDVLKHYTWRSGFEEHFQQALDFILFIYLQFQLAQDSFRQVREEIRRQQAEEQKAFQIQHGEKYIQLKNYTDQLEAELRETKSKMQALTTSNDELRECKTLKAQPSTRQFPSPTRSTMGGISMQQQDGGALVTQANQFNRPSMRSMGRAYAVDASTTSMRNSMANMGGPETPRTIQRPNVGMFDRFARPQIGMQLVT